jgi:hypothetical protein
LKKEFVLSGRNDYVNAGWDYIAGKTDFEDEPIRSRWEYIICDRCLYSPSKGYKVK